MKAYISKMFAKKHFMLKTSVVYLTNIRKHEKQFIKYYYVFVSWYNRSAMGHKKAAQTHEYETPQSLHKQIGQMTDSEVTEVVYTCFTTEQ
ncbi:hypothetical protein cypCar_00031207 [Cyprinus carpio]|nr:hypothetical protein cypCar_00031207 [Cyprinus carpio]